MNNLFKFPDRFGKRNVVFNQHMTSQQVCWIVTSIQTDIDQQGRLFYVIPRVWEHILLFDLIFICRVSSRIDYWPLLAFLAGWEQLIRLRRQKDSNLNFCNVPRCDQQKTGGPPRPRRSGPPRPTQVMTVVYCGAVHGHLDLSVFFIFCLQLKNLDTNPKYPAT